ncbi:unnamed protein product [Lathyrus oleraceus]
MSTTLFSEAPLVDEVDIVFECISSLFKGASCGRDGLRAQHLLDALYGEGFIVSRDLLCALITLVVNLWLGRRFQMSLRGFVASVPLKSLLKPDGGI